MTSVGIDTTGAPGTIALRQVGGTRVAVVAMAHYAAFNNVLDLAKEMTAAKADWQVHAYGNTMHAFTAEGANAPERGIKYDKAADRRSWAATVDFLKEVFG